MPRCPTSKRPGAFNAHNPGDGGSGLVQPVFRSPARIPAAESTQRTVRRAAKRKTLYVIMRENRNARAGCADLMVTANVILEFRLCDLIGTRLPAATYGPPTSRRLYPLGRTPRCSAGRPRCAVSRPGSVKEQVCGIEVGRFESLRKPVTDGLEQRQCLCAAILLGKQPCQAGCGA
jgi:hypothetical protein